MSGLDFSPTLPHSFPCEILKFSPEMLPAVAKTEMFLPLDVLSWGTLLWGQSATENKSPY